MISRPPADLRYTASHEWIKDEGDGTATVGITEHALMPLGDLLSVALPKVGRVLAANEACAVVESVQTGSDIHAPAAGEVIEVNTLLDRRPEIINEDPYNEGWLYRMRLSDSRALDDLLDADSYSEVY
jgi:glycine cleavage system H protein